jgi:hypothetical protein
VERPPGRLLERGYIVIEFFQNLHQEKPQTESRTEGEEADPTPNADESLESVSRESAFLAQHALEPHGATPPFRYLSLLG